MSGTSPSVEGSLEVVEGEEEDVEIADKDEVVGDEDEEDGEVEPERVEEVERDETESKEQREESEAAAEAEPEVPPVVVVEQTGAAEQARPIAGEAEAEEQAVVAVKEHFHEPAGLVAEAVVDEADKEPPVADDVQWLPAQALDKDTRPGTGRDMGKDRDSAGLLPPPLLLQSPAAGEASRRDMDEIASNIRTGSCCMHRNSRHEVPDPVDEMPKPGPPSVASFPHHPAVAEIRRVEGVSKEHSELPIYCSNAPYCYQSSLSSSTS